MWTVLKFFIEFVTILLLFYVLGFFFFFFGFKAYGISATQPGVEPACPCTGRVLTTGPLGEAPGVGFLMSRA